jgi:hypothetical protein
LLTAIPCSNLEPKSKPPQSLLCKNGDNDSCLASQQVELIRAAYAPLKKKNGEQIYPSFPPGSERGLNRVPDKQPMGVSLGSYRYVLYQDANWDWDVFDLEIEPRRSG